MPKIISFVNLKGGVGKTALSVNFAAFCGIQNLKTLLIDLDPQTNATFCSIGYDEWEQHASEKGTIADLLLPGRRANAEGVKLSPESVIIKSVFSNVDLVPSHLDLFLIDLDLASATARETKLRRALKDTIGEYDIIICDCPPNLAIPTQNALAFSTHYIVPISPDFLSALGVGILLNRIVKLGKELENEPGLAGIVISREGRRSIHRETTVNSLREQFGDKVLSPQIKERVAVSEAAEKHMSIFDYQKNGDAADEFGYVSEEIFKKVGM